MKNLRDDVKISLRKLRGEDHNVHEETETIFDEQQLSSEKVSYSDLFKAKSLRTPLIIALGLQITQQLSGVNAVFYYSGDIFNKAKPEIADFLTASVGLLNVFLTILSVFIMDKAGRRALLIFGEIVMIIVGVLYTISFSFKIDVLTIICTYLYVSGFAVGLGPIPFLILTEIFPTNGNPNFSFPFSFPLLSFLFFSFSLFFFFFFSFLFFFFFFFFFFF